MEASEARGDQVKVEERYLKTFTKEEINALKLKSYHGPIQIIVDPDQAEAALAGLAGESVLGFDTETQPSFKKGVSHPPSLLQLAGSRCVCLFRLDGAGLPDPVRELLSDSGIVKSGVSVRDDIIDLQRLSPFEEAGFVDLGDRARELGLKTHGLRNLAANLLGFRISKQARVSNWASPELTEKQIRYAATDAWVGRELFLAMETLGMVERG